ncbi:hypothetical protein JW710_01415 [Candidatus Dojkabacteria bacterium]|nr:hypothetical protein [Candidatus Dojkabacteria bacterium]
MAELICAQERVETPGEVLPLYIPEVQREGEETAIPREVLLHLADEELLLRNAQFLKDAGELAGLVIPNRNALSFVSAFASPLLELSQVEIKRMLKSLEAARPFSELFFQAEMGIPIGSPVDQNQLYALLFDTLASSSGTLLPVSASHASEIELFDAAVDLGLDPSTVAALVLDTHDDVFVSVESTKSSVCHKLLCRGIGHLSIIGISDERYSDLVRNPPSGEYLSLTDEQIADLTLTRMEERGINVLDVIRDQTYGRFGDRFSLIPRGELRGGPNYSKKKIEERITNLLDDLVNRGITQIWIQIDLDVLDLLGEMITVTPYGFVDTILAASIQDLTLGLEVKGITDPEAALTRVLNLFRKTHKMAKRAHSKNNHTMNGRQKLEDQYINASSTQREARAILIGIQDQIQRFVRYGLITPEIRSSLGPSYGICPFVIHSVERKGLRLANVLQIIKTARAFCSSHNGIEFGICAGNVHIPLTIDEVALTDVNGNGVKAVSKMIAAATSP